MGEHKNMSSVCIPAHLAGSMTHKKPVFTKYQKRISGPLLDRIDIHIEVLCVDSEKLSGEQMGEIGKSIRKRVQAARGIQQQRFASSQSKTLFVTPICASGRRGNFVSCSPRARA